MNLTQVEARQKRGKHYSAMMATELMNLDIGHKCCVCGVFSGRDFDRNRDTNFGEVALLAGKPPLCQSCQEWRREVEAAGGTQ